MTADPATIGYYQTLAPHLTFSFGQAPSRHLDAFLNRLKPGARILELGCGGGRDAARIAERGFNLDATDGTPAMVRKAKARYDVGARLMRFDELDADGEYHAIWAHACLIHVPRAEFDTVIAAVFRALCPGGWHFANFQLGRGEDRDLLGRLQNFPDEVWLEDAYRNAGFAIEKAERYCAGGVDGGNWYALTLHKAEA